MHDPINLDNLQAGGPLSEDKRYVVRRADSELLEALSAGTLCYVLAPRQIGKSSLRVRTARLLRQAGLRCATLSLDQIASAESEDQWYGTLISLLARQLRLPTPLDSDCSMTPVARFRAFLRDRVLEQVKEPVVIFIDELDTILSLGIRSDDFLAALRACDNDRAEDSAWHRLRFCLLGVASPADLIADATRTPFNVGRGILLEDFTRHELDAFAPDVSGLGIPAAAVLDEVHAWTSGQPYMTQRLCVELKKRENIGRDEHLQLIVASAVNELFLARGRTQDPQLSYAEQRLDSRSDAARLLQLYRQLLDVEIGHRAQPIAAEGGDRIQLELRLCGLAAERTGHGTDSRDRRFLRPRNKIFMKVFDPAWVDDTLARRPITEAVRRWRAGHKAPALLLRGDSLRGVQAWARAHPINLTADDYEFLSQSQEHQQARRNRTIIGGLSLLVFALLIATAAAYGQRNQAQRQTERAQKLASQNQLQSDELRKEKDRAEDFVTQLRYQKAAIQAEKERAEKLSVELRGRSEELERQTGRAEQATQRALTEKAHAEQAAQKAKEQAAHAETQRLKAEEATNRAEQFVRIERSLRALMMAEKPNRVLEALSLGMQAAEPEVKLKTQDPRVWEGLVASTQKASEAQLLTSGYGSVFAANGGRLAISVRRSIEIWDTQHGVRLNTLPRRDHYPVSLSDDGKFALVRFNTRRDDKYIEEVGLLNVSNGLLPIRLVVPRFRWFGMLSPDGQKLAILREGRQIELWDVTKTKIVKYISIIGRQMWSRGIFSPDGQRLLMYGNDATASILSTRLGVVLAKIAVKQGSIRSAAFSSDGKYVIASDFHGTAQIFDASTGGVVCVVENQDNDVVAVAFSSDNKLLALAMSDSSVGVYSGKNCGFVQSLQGHEAAVRAIVFTPDGQQIVTGSNDGTVRRWPLSRNRITYPLNQRSFGGRVLAVASSLQRVVVANQRGSYSTVLLDISTGQKIELKNCQADWAIFSVDNQRVVTLNFGTNVQVWDANNGQLLYTMSEAHYSSRNIACSPDGRFLAMSGDNDALRIIDINSGDVVTRVAEKYSTTNALSYSHDGRRIATVGIIFGIRIWDARSGQKIGTISSSAVDGIDAKKIAYSPDGRKIAVSYDRIARVWDATDGHFLYSLKGHEDQVTDLAFSPDSSHLVTISDDKTAKVWDMNNGKILLTLRGHRNGLNKAIFSADGAEIITGDKDGLVLVHPVAFTEYYRFACRVLLGISQIREVSNEQRNSLLETCSTNQ